MKKVIIGLVLILSVAMLSGCGKKESSNDSSTNTAKDGKVTEISSAKDFEKLIDGTYPLDGNYKMTQNIDLSELDKGKGIPSIGESNGFEDKTMFSGTFDGGKYKIKGFKQTLTDKSNGAGLFAMTSGATIKDLTIEDANLIIDPALENPTYKIGVLVGEARKSTSFENCNVSGVIDGSGTKVSATDVGGLAGSIIGGEYNKKDDKQTTVKQVMVKVDITLPVEGEYTQLVGGIVGLAEEVDFSSVVSFGKVEAPSGLVIGGFAGQARSCNFDKCAAEGNVTGQSDVGGFIGSVDHFGGGHIKNCYETGDVTVTGSDKGGLFMSELASIVKFDNIYASGKMTVVERPDGSANNMFNETILIDKNSRSIYYNSESVSQKIASDNPVKQSFIPLTFAEMGDRKNFVFKFDGSDGHWTMDKGVPTPRLSGLDYEIFK